MFFQLCKWSTFLLIVFNLVQCAPQPEGEHQKGQELFEAGQFAEAAEELTRSIRKDGPTYWKHYYRGLAHFKLRKNNAAIVDFKQAIRLDTEHPSAYFSLGYTYHALKSDNEALKNYNLAIAKVDIYALTDETRTVAAKSYFNRGILYGGFKQFQDAINDFSTSIQIDGSFGDSYYRRGVFRLVLSQGQQGCDDILVGLQKGSADHYNMGQECQQK